MERHASEIDLPRHGIVDPNIHAGAHSCSDGALSERDRIGEIPDSDAARQVRSKTVCSGRDFAPDDVRQHGHIRADRIFPTEAVVPKVILDAEDSVEVETLGRKKPRMVRRIADGPAATGYDRLA
jgi:hypothetical protein